MVGAQFVWRTRLDGPAATVAWWGVAGLRDPLCALCQAGVCTGPGGSHGGRVMAWEHVRAVVEAAVRPVLVEAVRVTDDGELTPEAELALVARFARRAAEDGLRLRPGWRLRARLRGGTVEFWAECEPRRIDDPEIWEAGCGS